MTAVERFERLILDVLAAGELTKREAISLLIARPPRLVALAARRVA